MNEVFRVDGNPHPSGVHSLCGIALGYYKNLMIKKEAVIPDQETGS